MKNTIFMVLRPNLGGDSISFFALVHSIEAYSPFLRRKLLRPQAILSSLNSGVILKSINHTFITLIPTVHNLEKVTDFWLISLCNVIYKIVSKKIANRLKPMLNSIISETQSAFTAKRLITDNILIAFESLHHMKTNCTGKKRFYGFKVGY